MGPKTKLAAIGAFMLSLYVLVLFDKMTVDQYLDIAKLIGTALGSHLFTAWVPVKAAVPPAPTEGQ